MEGLASYFQEENGCEQAIDGPDHDVMNFFIFNKKVFNLEYLAIIEINYKSSIPDKEEF